MDQYSNYDLCEDDPYLIEGSQCLINRLGFTDTESLNIAEGDLTQVTLADLIRNPVTPTFNLAHLQAIHQRLFGDVYYFAGEIRTTEIMKGGKLFLPHARISMEAEVLFAKLHNENLIQGLAPAEFGERAGHYLGKINMIHAFREGNGRTQRVFIDQLAALNNYAIEWAGISGEAMARACREARKNNPVEEPLQNLISLQVVRAPQNK